MENESAQYYALCQCTDVQLIALLNVTLFVTEETVTEMLNSVIAS